MPIAASLQRALEGIVGRGGVLTALEDLLCYAQDGTAQGAMPDVVVEPRDTAQVSALLALAGEQGLPVVTRGSGSGLAGGAVPFGGGMVLSLTRMRRILEIDRENLTAAVQGGVVTHDLQTAVEALGLFYPPDPSSVRHCTIGGNIACNAGGARCLKYGVTANYVLGLTVVLADGQVLRCGGKTLKNVTGYNLVQLFTGSEGTLGVITEALLRLVPRPTQARTAVAAFAQLDQAGSAVGALLGAGIVPAAVELMDATAVHCIEAAHGLGLPLEAEGILLLEVDGFAAAEVEREIGEIARICRAGGAFALEVAGDEAQRQRLWRARRSVSPALARRAPNKLGEDICVPRSQIPEAIRRIQAISRRHGLPIAIFGHAGDGNLHPNILYDRRDPQQRAVVACMAGEIFDTALALGGTLSGEHGIGVLKRPYLERDLGALSIAVQRRIRQALDPRGLLNPDKVLPPVGQQGEKRSARSAQLPPAGRSLAQRLRRALAELRGRPAESGGLSAASCGRAERSRATSPPRA
jgi:glycolate oxidase